MVTEQSSDVPSVDKVNKHDVNLKREDLSSEPNAGVNDDHSFATEDTTSSICVAKNLVCHLTSTQTNKSAAPTITTTTTKSPVILPPQQVDHINDGFNSTEVNIPSESQKYFFSDNKIENHFKVSHFSNPKANMENFHKSMKFAIYQCSVCQEAWPLKTKPKHLERYVCCRCSRQKYPPKVFS